MLIDTHCHLTLDKFDQDRQAVINRAVEVGVDRMLVLGLDLESSLAAVRLAEKHSCLRAAVGFHPTEIERMTPQSFEELSALAKNPVVAAIGEIGLDYYWITEPEKRIEQNQKLASLLTLAGSVGKPIVLHLREEQDALAGNATSDLFDLVEKWYENLSQNKYALKDKPGVFHSFNGNLESARRALDMNFYIGFAGPITYKKAETHRELARQIPLDRILVETDSPYQTPEPFRGRRNEPANVRLVADKIAEIHDITSQQVTEVTTRNAMRLFGWEGNA